MKQHITYQECAVRYPRLVRAMQWAAILSPSEAACALRDWRDGVKLGGGEAVTHFGGIEKTINAAWASRKFVREQPHKEML